mgnify:FL=1
MIRQGTRAASLAALAAAATLLLAGAAEAKPKLAGTFQLSGQPGQIAASPPGAAWVVIKGSSQGNDIARVRPNGTVAEFDLAVSPVGIEIGPDGNVWVTHANGVTKVNPANPSDNTTYTIPAIAQPQEITKGPGRKLWTASGDKLISFKPGNPAGFAAKDLGANTSARGIAAAGKNVWVADFNDGKILRVKPGGAIKRFNVGGGPQDVAQGKKGRVAYTNQGTNPHTVGRIVGKRVRKKRVPDTDPFGIAFAGGNWWIANFASHDLTILSPKGKLRRFRKLPNNSGPRYVAKGKGRKLWVALELSERLALIKGI